MTGSPPSQCVGGRKKKWIAIIKIFLLYFFKTEFSLNPYFLTMLSQVLYSWGEIQYYLLLYWLGYFIFFLILESIDCPKTLHTLSYTPICKKNKIHLTSSPQKFQLGVIWQKVLLQTILSNFNEILRFVPKTNVLLHIQIKLYIVYLKFNWTLTTI